MNQRQDRIRVHIGSKEFNVVGGQFQDMLAAVKQVAGRRFVTELKVWQLPGSVENIQHQLEISGYRLEGGTSITAETPTGQQKPQAQPGNDRIRLAVGKYRLAVVGGSFQEMLAAVKSLPGRRFNGETKIWEIPGDVAVIKVLIEAAGFQLEGTETIQIGPAPPMESLDFLEQPAAPPPAFEEPNFDDADDFLPPEPPDWWDDDLMPPPASPVGWDDETISPPFDDTMPFDDEPNPFQTEVSDPHPVAFSGKQGSDQIRIRWGDVVLVVSGGSFQEMLAAVKNIPERRFNGQEKVWEIPPHITLETIQQRVSVAGFVVTQM